MGRTQKQHYYFERDSCLLLLRVQSEMDCAVVLPMDTSQGHYFGYLISNEVTLLAAFPFVQK